MFDSCLSEFGCRRRQGKIQRPVISAWLSSIDDEDLFSEKGTTDSFLSFGTPLMLNGAPSLEESGWKALPTINEEDSAQPRRMFGS